MTHICNYCGSESASPALAAPSCAQPAPQADLVERLEWIANWIRSISVSDMPGTIFEAIAALSEAPQRAKTPHSPYPAGHTKESWQKIADESHRRASDLPED